jgi:hypothetical protein
MTRALCVSAETNLDRGSVRHSLKVNTTSDPLAAFFRVVGDSNRDLEAAVNRDDPGGVRTRNNSGSLQAYQDRNIDSATPIKTQRRVRDTSAL